VLKTELFPLDEGAISLMKKSFARASFMPSFTGKSHSGTHRLHFRRRAAAEGHGLLIIRAAGFLINLETIPEANGTTLLTLMVNPKGLKMVAELLKTHQVALVVDAKTKIEHDFVKETLIDKLMLRVDAVYGFDTVSPSSLLFDVTQILTDFHLLSEYHKRKFGTSKHGLFTLLDGQAD
jgi:hypothetical protein